MIDRETHAEIRRMYYADHFTVNRISSELGVHHETVKRAINQDGKNPRKPTPRIIDEWSEEIKSIVERNPDIRSTRVKSILEDKGYSGSIYPIRDFIRELRPTLSKTYLPLNFLPGEQGQVDWADFGSIQVGATKRKLNLFVMVLSYSRMIYAEFYFDQKLPSFLEAHVNAFRYFKGVPRNLVYDNLKSAVIERSGKAIKFNKSLLELASTFHFKPVACNPRSGWEKGRVERSIRYIRDSFFEARALSGLSVLNNELSDWIRNETTKRAWPDDTNLKVWQAFEKETLLPFHKNEFEAYEEAFAKVSKTSTVRFDTNIYSVPPGHVGQKLTIRATLTTVAVFDSKLTEITKHSREWDRKKTIISPKHLEEIADSRRINNEGKSRGEFRSTFSCADELLDAWNFQDENLGSCSRRILDMLSFYSRNSIEEACLQALEKGTPSPSNILYLLSKKPESPKVVLKNLPKEIQSIEVKNHDLATFDDLF